MRTFILVALVFFSLHTSGQVVSSSCLAPDSIVETYTEDAYRMMMKRFFRNNISYKDSVQIPFSYVDTVMRALLAVYNATGLPARDTVVSMFDIHTYPIPYLDEIMVGADSGLAWMQQLQSGIIPTGDSAIDSIMSHYDLQLFDYDTIPNAPWDMAVFDTDSNYNTFALCSLFMSLPGVTWADPVSMGGDGNEIVDSVFADKHVELTYGYGWGDCWSGCIFNRYWKFSVDTNCTVEYLGSYGNDISLMSGVGHTLRSEISVSPNPFQEHISLNGINMPFNYSLSNLAGSILKKGICFNNVVDNLDFLCPGIYFLQIDSGSYLLRFKILKGN